MLWHRIKRWMAGLLAVIVTACAAPLTLAEKAHEPVESAPLGVSIRMEDEEIQAAGEGYSLWAERMARAREEGLASPMTLEALKAVNPEAELLASNGRVYMLRGAEGLGALPDAFSACRAAFSLAELLEISREISLRLWGTLTLGATRVYVFQQVYEGLTVLGSVIKLVTGADGQAKAVFSSLSVGEPVTTGARQITAAEAEELVRETLRQQGEEADILPEFTGMAVLPADADIDSEELLPDELVWIVYSANPDFYRERSVDLPYLAHYVRVSGEYMRACQVITPGDTASTRAGYPAGYVFTDMERGEWSGQISLGRDETMELTVPVMRDVRTGVWYLGDVERRIAVADFGTLFYGEKRVRMVSSQENSGWDDVDLITYATMLRVYDYYAARVWYGPDGVGTPILLLSDLCLKNGDPVDNAAYCGLAYGWQCFAFGRETVFGRAVDVIAHEFTHGVTTAMMTANLYQDDYGAINEAMSDIMGNICEGELGATWDKEWLLGESLGMPFRSMSDPHLFDQPEYVWDVFYTPAVTRPNDVNDRGGVHSNSSILNRVAAMLCMEGGMSLRQAGDFWLMAAAGMTPGTDYVQMPDLLTWALETSGNGMYHEKLAELMAYSRMTETKKPEGIPEDRRVVTLRLPDTETMADPYWVMLAYQLNTEEAGRLLSMAGKALTAMVSDVRERGLDGLVDQALALGRLLVPYAALTPQERLERTKLLSGLYSQHMSWASDTGGEVIAVMNRQPALYMMLNIDPDTLDVRGMALLIGDHWYDLSKDLEGEALASQLTDDLALALDRLFGPQEGGELRLPSDGLEHVTIEPLQRELEKKALEEKEREATSTDLQ